MSGDEDDVHGFGDGGGDKLPESAPSRSNLSSAPILNAFE
eukprot:gene10747-9422_t